MAYHNYFRRGKPRFRQTPKARSVIVKRKRRSNYSGLRLSAPMRTLVDKSIHKNLETKQAIQQITGGVAPGQVYGATPPFNANGNGGFWSLIPRIDKGTDRDQRTGNQIKVRSCRVTCYCILPAATVGSETDRSLIQMRVIAGTTKGRQNYTSLYDDTAATANFIVRDGTNATSLQGNFQTMDLPLNHAVVTKHYDRHIMLKTDTGNGDTINNACYKFSFNIPMKNKVLRYVEAENFPRNAAPWLGVTWNYANGASPTLSPAVPLFWYQSTLNYEDA